MALADTLLKEGFNQHLLAVHGNPFRILNGDHAGQSFLAIDEVAQAIDPETQLSVDDRELIILHCAAEQPGVVPTTQLAGIGATWLVLRRQNNPGDVSVDYTCAKIIPGKDNN